MPFRIRVTVAILLALFGAAVVAPLVVPIAELEGTVPAEQLLGPDGRFVEVDGRAVHVREGSGPASGDRAPLLLIHGFGSSLEASVKKWAARAGWGFSPGMRSTRSSASGTWSSSRSRRTR